MTCKNCEVELKGKCLVYCSIKCQFKYQHSEYIKRWKEGKEKGWIGKARALSKHIRRHLLEVRGTACCKCGWDDNHPLDGRSLTEVDHIDGDAENCKEDNLQIVCPNCHSKTHTYRNRNSNSKRIR
jgi:predicted HNH restriction endonuclease